jgi:hypothetical protein
VDIEYPNFLVSAIAHLAGVHTDSLKFVEWDIKTPIANSFLLQLTDDRKHQWFEIASDSPMPSFVKLPLEKRIVLAPCALSFIMRTLLFFRNAGMDSLHGTFTYGEDTLGAIVFRVPGSQNAGSPAVTISRLETWNKCTGEEYNSAEVTAVTQNGYTTFRDIKVYLKRKNITIRLTSVRVTVSKSEY